MSDTLQAPAQGVIPHKYPWYWNDLVNPFATDRQWRATEDIIGLHRGRDEDVDDLQIPMRLVDAHLDMGDEIGADFWRWVAETDRRPDFYKGMWWFDNNLLYPTESRYAIPAAACLLIERGEVRHLKPAKAEIEQWGDHEGDHYDKSVGGMGEVGAGVKISEIAFDGRLTAETTLLQAWRKMTPTERERARTWDETIKWIEVINQSDEHIYNDVPKGTTKIERSGCWDFDYIDPSREVK